MDISKALRELSGIREANREESRRRQNEVYVKLPRIMHIDMELMRAGVGFSRSILTHENNFEDIKNTIIKLNNEKRTILEKSGYAFDYLDDIYNCKKCRDTGFVLDKKCECLREIINKNISQGSNLTVSMKEQTFEKFDFSLFKNDLDSMKKMVSLCENFADGFENEGKNIYIFGSVGTGKTFLSSCIANRALKRGKSVYYQTAYRLFDIAGRVKFGKAEENDDELLKYIYNADLLIIDDLGTEVVTALSSSALFDILNSRLLDKKSTIINSNLTPQELGNTYSERILSRIIGSYAILTLKSGDLRVRLKSGS